MFKKALQKGIVTEKNSFSEGIAPGRVRGALEVANSCTKCMNCINLCPTKALAYHGEKLVVDYGKCIFCGRCVSNCPEKALKHTTVYGLAQTEREDIIAPVGELQELKSVLNKEIQRTFNRSLHIRHLDSGSCNACDWEMNSMMNPVHDLQRLGIDVVASPRHADIILVTGTVSKHLEQAVKMTYEAAAEPKLVMAVGSCAIDGGIFNDSYAILNGADKIIPVDVYVPGCPPRPQAIIYGLLKILGKYPS
jgi:Ni,Fe-hydrogenase III small subunit/ferredoxin